MAFALAEKQQMTTVFSAEGGAFPATILKLLPLTVTQVKTDEGDGYRAVQVGAGTQKESRISKAQRPKGAFRYLKEFRVADTAGYTQGEASALSFEAGDVVSVSARSKGKGFQGVVKRHGFHGGPRSHGQRHTERAPGSIGAGGPQEVRKGMKMAGRMGGTRITVKNLKVLQVDANKGVLVVSGAVPGRRGTFVEVRGQVTGAKK